MTLPWFDHLYEKNRRPLGDDRWAYRVEANRKAIDAFLPYPDEQGLARAGLSCENNAAAELLNT